MEIHINICVNEKTLDDFCDKEEFSDDDEELLKNQEDTHDLSEEDIADMVKFTYEEDFVDEIYPMG